MDYGFGMPFLSDRPVGEDGYYMLTVAWNLAEKGRMVYDLEKRTTGVQPLATFVYAAIARVVQAFHGDKWDFVRWIILSNVVLIVVFAHLVGQIARAGFHAPAPAELAYAVATVMALSSVWVFRLFTYGLETGLYLTLIAATVLATLRRGHPIVPLKLGILGGFAGLARIDFGILFGLVLARLLGQRRLTWRATLVAGGIAAVMTAPWILWVHSETGNWVPSSGPAQSRPITPLDATSRVRTMATALVSNMVPALYFADNGRRILPDAIGMAALALLSLTIASGIWLARRSNDWPVSRDFVHEILAWGMHIAILAPVYLVMFRAVHFYARYMSPLLVVVFPSLAVAIVAASRRLRVLPFVLLCVFPALFVCFAALSLHSGRMGFDFPINAGFVRDRLQGYRIGAAQSGVLGYYNENVVNLDGKVDPEARVAAVTTGIRTYIDSQQIDMLVDWPEIISRYYGKGRFEQGWRLCAQQPQGRSRCFERRIEVPPPEN